MSKVHGLLLMDKPIGPSSYQALRLIARQLPGVKVGHTGTLDPLASGLLVVLVGEATKIAPFLVEEPKVYQANVLLGVETDTYDIGGKVLRECPVATDEEAVKEAFLGLAGDRMQVPPPFSAAKVGGKPMYQLARQGKRVDGKPRRIKVYSVEIGGMTRRGDKMEVELRISCSRGTYIRSLCHEAGVKLGCGAALAGLRRLAAGPFRVEEAMGPEQWSRKLREGETRDILSIVDALPHLRRVQVKGETARRVRHGYPLPSLPDKGVPVLVTGEGDVPLSIQLAEREPGGRTRVLRVFNL